MRGRWANVGGGERGNGGSTGNCMYLEVESTWARGGSDILSVGDFVESCCGSVVLAFGSGGRKVRGGVFVWVVCGANPSIPR